jgi:site-specific DNA-methyltransferase (adenine-specific)
MNWSDKITVTNEDNMALMSRYTDNYFDLAIVDPPYGIDIETSGTYFKQFETKGWDTAIPSKEYFDELKRVSKNQIVWGGNYFLEYLGSTKCFLIWDKMIGEGMSFADAELAWCSFKKPTRIKKLLSRNPQGKIHPTQKPEALYDWILDKYAKQGDKILDTHLGSGSIAIACHDYGFELTACELDTEYYEAAKKRFMNHSAQQKLF